MLPITYVSTVWISATLQWFFPDCTSSHPVVTFCFTTLFPSILAYCHWTIPPWQLRFNPRSGYVGSVVNKVALGQVFSEYVGFPCKFSFYWLHHTNLPSGAGRMGHQWPIYQVTPSHPNPPQPTQPLNKGRFLLLETHLSHCSVTSKDEVIFRVARSTDSRYLQIFGLCVAFNYWCNISPLFPWIFECSLYKVLRKIVKNTQYGPGTGEQSHLQKVP
jgi:hypothetical protein